MIEVLAVIPARGGSKSVPRKNVLTIAGFPLIAHTIRAALSAKRVCRVAVSTDDVEIAEIAREYGAEVIDRPPSLASDEASSESALLHALEHLKQTEDYEPDLLCFLQCTSPLTIAEDVDGVIEALVTEGGDSALAVAKFHGFIWEHDASGEAVGVNHNKNVRLRRQERQAEYLETGAVYAMKVAGFRASGHRFFGKTVLYSIPANRVLEIDEPADFEIAQSRMSTRESDGFSTLLKRVEGIVFDFDGVFTDDRVLVDENGREAVFCSRSDGMGIERLHNAGIPMMVLSKELNAVVARRCEKLKLDVAHGVSQKLPLLVAWASDRGLTLDRLAYVGNDINDIDCMRAVGCAVAPADAHPAARAVATIVLDQAGGRGAIRKLSDLILGTGK